MFRLHVPSLKNLTNLGLSKHLDALQVYHWGTALSSTGYKAVSAAIQPHNWKMHLLSRTNGQHFSNTTSLCHHC